MKKIEPLHAAFTNIDSAAFGKINELVEVVNKLIDKAPKRSKNFVKPLVADITEYAASIGFPLDAQKFYDYYESKGWMIGKNKMKNWQASVRTWFRSFKDNNPGFSPNIPETQEQQADNKEQRAKLKKGLFNANQS